MLITYRDGRAPAQTPEPLRPAKRTTWSRDWRVFALAAMPLAYYLVLQ